MRSYAQTNIQLFNQLRREGYSTTELNLIRDAYELAMTCYSCRFSPSGRPFIAHVIRTASILASLPVPPKVVAAGLIHNIYEKGDFGDGRRGISPARRKRVASLVGQEVEEYVAKFPTLYWESRTTQLARDNPDKLSLIDRNILLTLFADHLEHLLDYDVLYYDYAVAQYYIDHSKIAAEIAEGLGVCSLAAHLREAIRAAKSAELPIDLTASKIRHASSLVVPNSCRKRFPVALRRFLAHTARASRTPMDKLKFLHAKLAKSVEIIFGAKSG
jgi:(p)ppGpp synthase/HD superfamily hydrolase